MAAAIGALNPLLRRQRRILELVAIAISAVVAGLLVVIMIRVAHHDETYWFGGFRPHHGIAISVYFEVGPLSAARAALAAVLVTAGMVFSWRYFERIATYYHVLMLAFLAGMTRVLPDGRRPRHVRVVRADERGGLRADRGHRDRRGHRPGRGRRGGGPRLPGPVLAAATPAAPGF